MFSKVFAKRIFLSVCLLSVLAYFPSKGFSSPDSKSYTPGEIIVQFNFNNRNKSDRLRGRNVNKTYRQFVKELFQAAQISRKNKSTKPRFEPLHTSLAEISTESGKNETELNALFSRSAQTLNNDFGFLRTLKIQVPLKTDIEELAEKLSGLNKKISGFRIVSARPNYILDADCSFTQYRLLGSRKALINTAEQAWPVACENPVESSSAESDALRAVISGANLIKLGIFPASDVFDSGLIKFADANDVAILAQAKPEKAALSLPPPLLTITPTPIPTFVPTSKFPPLATRTPTPQVGETPVPPQPTFFPSNTPVINNPQPTNRPQATKTPKGSKKFKFFRLTVLNGKKPVKNAKVTYIYVGGKAFGTTDKKGFVAKSFRTGTLVAASIKAGSRETSTDSYKLTSDRNVTVRF